MREEGSSPLDNSAKNTRDTLENKLNMITKTAPPIGGSEGQANVCLSASHAHSEERGRDSSCDFPQFLFPGRLPGQMARLAVTCVKCYCRSSVFYLSELNGRCKF